MEKEPESLAVRMKSDYASSEVYSTAGSEAPPAYNVRQSNSVKIAKIIAGTIIASSIILGCFILAATYMQSHAVCDQIRSLEDALDKEMMLEVMSQNAELPKPAALKDNEMEDSKTIDKNDVEEDKEESKSDSDFPASKENSDAEHFQIKFPLDVDLNELVGKFLQANERSELNCVIENRRNSEAASKRLAIVCDSTSEAMRKPEIHIRQLLIPFARSRFPIPYGNMPQPGGMEPLTHMPLNMIPEHQLPPASSQMMQQPIVNRFQLMQPQRVQQMQPPSPPQVMQHIQLRLLQPQAQNGVQVQEVPLSVAMQRAGISPEDLNIIKKIAETKLQQEMNQMMENENEQGESESAEDETEGPKDAENMNQPQNPFAMGRLGFARSLLKPVNIPIQMMPKDVTGPFEKQEQNPE